MRFSPPPPSLFGPATQAIFNKKSFFYSTLLFLLFYLTISFLLLIIPLRYQFKSRRTLVGYFASLSCCSTTQMTISTLITKVQSHLAFGLDFPDSGFKANAYLSSIWMSLSARLRRSWGYQWCQQSTSMRFQALRSCAKV